MAEHPRRLDVAIEAVQAACRVCDSLQKQLANLQKMHKNDRSPVTVADFASQAVVNNILQSNLGPFSMIAEEDAQTLRDQIEAGETAIADAVCEAANQVWSGATRDDVIGAIDLGHPSSERSHAHGYWTLDPIDGTKGFLRGGQYSVCLAWIEGGEVTLGVLGCPNLSLDFGRPFDDPDPHGSIYFASAHEGAWEMRGDAERSGAVRLERLHRTENEPLRLCESVDGSHTSHDVAERAMGKLGELAEPLRLDGQGKYAVVARGQADVYLRLPRGGYIERIWDHAAGALISHEAGCAASDARGAQLEFGHGAGMDANRGVVVTAQELHGPVIGALDEVAHEGS